MSKSSAHALGDFLRSRRAKLTPKAVGLNGSQRRRTAGLRREEVAELAGIGVDWYIRLEQGRAVQPSATTVDALARALRLTKHELEHMRALAFTTDRRPFERETVPPALERIVQGLNLPAYVTGRRWDVLAWNQAADAMLDFSNLPQDDRNTLLIVLTKKSARRLFGATWAQEAKRMVALFRATHDLWAGDPAFTLLRERLRCGCPEFAEWWSSHDIAAPSGGLKLLSPRGKGQVQLEFVTCQCNDAPDLRLTIYRPA